MVDESEEDRFWGCELVENEALVDFSAKRTLMREGWIGVGGAGEEL